jgi:oxygen-independent coproporphyrinogen-3 oxidase
MGVAGSHLSLYQLTIEPGTQFYTRFYRGDFEMPSEEQGAELYEFTNDYLMQRGLHQYEVSNYAQPGQECRHNLTYWRYQDYGGIGPGAHGRLSQNGGKVATYAFKSPDKWLTEVGSGDGIQDRISISKDERWTEMIMMGLRLREGIQLNRLREELGEGSTFHDLPNLSMLIKGGFLDLTDECLRATPQGLQRLNGVLKKLLG